ncbi:MAG TPA: nucleoside triphosphate pyrophosphohydrolase [candidate division Zixibacteria bacterium]|mgnify:CR=1 FL=1|nr:nucleoside triphosphate pyrophosphohydrolase [candidate division Zixibacteria bacterium]
MSEFERLVGIMRKLRAPDGCPWDRKQNHKSLIPYLLEETYEVIDSIEDGDMNKLREELGDLLLQIVFHSQMASEEGSFNIEDVARSISEKLINRHPHIFKQKAELTPDEVTHNWEQIKLREKEDKSESALSGIPRTAPALLRAFRLQQKAARFGFDWEKWQDVLVKAEEEIRELQEAIESSSTEKIEEEIGDLLFAVVNLARFFEIDPETALNHMNKKFIDRFRYVEKKLAQNGKSLNDSNLEEMDSFWNEAKMRSRDSDQ